jgi:hypothetical protein
VAIKSFEDPQEVLFRLGDGVLAHLASDTLDQAARVDADGGRWGRRRRVVGREMPSVGEAVRYADAATSGIRAGRRVRFIRNRY